MASPTPVPDEKTSPPAPAPVSEATAPPPPTVVAAAPAPAELHTVPRTTAPSHTVPVETREVHWENGLCNGVCGGPLKTCLTTWICPCYVFGQVSQRLARYPSTGPYRTTSLDTWLYGIGCHNYLSCWVPLMIRRGDMRERFGIAGDEGKDCCLSCCCSCCVLAQMDTEMKRRAAREQRAKAQGYLQPADGMHYQAQA